jgi:hypothetical protein
MLKKLISGITPGIGRTIEGPRFTILQSERNFFSLKGTTFVSVLSSGW